MSAVYFVYFKLSERRRIFSIFDKNRLIGHSKNRCDDKIPNYFLLINFGYGFCRYRSQFQQLTKASRIRSKSKILMLVSPILRKTFNAFANVIHIFSKPQMSLLSTNESVERKQVWWKMRISWNWCSWHGTIKTRMQVCSRLQRQPFTIQENLINAFSFRAGISARNGTEAPDLSMVGSLWAQYQNALVNGGIKLQSASPPQSDQPLSSPNGDNPDESSSSGQKDDDDGSEDDSDDRLDQNTHDPERLKAFNVSVLVFCSAGFRDIFVFCVNNLFIFWSVFREFRVFFARCSCAYLSTRIWIAWYPFPSSLRRRSRPSSTHAPDNFRSFPNGPGSGSEPIWSHAAGTKRHVRAGKQMRHDQRQRISPPYRPNKFWHRPARMKA